MSSAQQERLIEFLHNGKSIYIEGIDVASSLENTELLDMLGVSLLSQGNYMGSILTIHGLEDTFAEDFFFNYAHDTELDYLVDELIAESGEPFLQSQDDIVRAVYHDNGYRTITSSTIFGGMKEGTDSNSKSELMKRYLAFLQNGFDAEAHFFHSSLVFDSPAGYETEFLFPIQNKGLGELVIQTVDFTENTGFSFGIELPFIIPFDSFATIPILFQNPNPGLFEDTLVLQTNAGSFSISLSVNNYPPPLLTYSPAEFYFDLHPDDEPFTSWLSLENSGEDTLAYSIQLFENAGETVQFDYFVQSEVEYQWLEIADIGESLELSGTHHLSDAIELNESFVFYGKKYDNLYVSGKGILSFLPFSAVHSLNMELPEPAFPLPIIAAFWDDLTDETGNVFFYQDEEKAVIQFDNRSRFQGISGGSYTFQIVLNNNQTILLQYKELNGNIESCTVGMQSERGEHGIQLAYNELFLTNEKAVLLYSQPEWLSLSETQGSINISHTANIELNFLTDHLRIGDYYSSLVLHTNAPDHIHTVIPIHLSVTETSQTADSIPTAESITLLGNYPNPFNPQTNIIFEIDGAANIELMIYNAKGQKIKQERQILNRGGIHSYLWDGTDAAGRQVASGIYFYKLQSGHFAATKRMILMK